MKYFVMQNHPLPELTHEFQVYQTYMVFVSLSYLRLQYNVVHAAGFLQMIPDSFLLEYCDQGVRIEKRP